MSVEEFLLALREALDTRRRQRVAELCRGLASELRSGSVVTTGREAGKILALLKSYRCFAEVVVLGGVLSRLHQDNARIRRLLAQGLIDQGHLTDAPELLDQALGLLERMVAEPDVRPDELEEAWGLIGRVHKQLYVMRPESPHEDSMNAALDAYGQGWEASRNPWHGINLVALLMRAGRDGLSPVTPHDPDAIARELLDDVEERIDEAKASLWDHATAMEAAIALGDADRAVSMAESYVKQGLDEGRDEFEFASTVRQLREVWQLDPDGSEGSAILPMLDAVILDRGLRASEGSGVLQFESASLARVRSEETFARLERVFGDDNFVPMRWLNLLFDRLHAIGSVATRAGRGVGTGFMVRGTELSAELGDGWYFVTNSHVVTDDEEVLGSAPPERRPCRPEQVAITFELFFRANPIEYHVAEVVWTSPPAEFDVSILRLEQEFEEDDLAPYPVTSELPDPESRPRLYIAGHPGGGGLQVSMHDNHLLQFDDDRMQYRTPTNPGSSGSPVFNDEWELVGIHHAGSVEMAALDGSGKVHEANQGIRLSAILVRLNAFLSGTRAES